MLVLKKGGTLLLSHLNYCKMQRFSIFSVNMKLRRLKNSPNCSGILFLPIKNKKNKKRYSGKRDGTVERITAHFCFK